MTAGADLLLAVLVALQESGSNSVADYSSDFSQQAGEVLVKILFQCACLESLLQNRILHSCPPRPFCDSDFPRSSIGLECGNLFLHIFLVLLHHALCVAAAISEVILLSSPRSQDIGWCV
ncbi:hypothetical protein Nepgr_005901 [Nepenthes gracilis]|uniref:Secreted protein n=1 Tax=Nepenthes gracilis TaxID=150966 RepID=A0AAD3XGV8_NEPGR|nr:hypothetical protein Nepgr_005901 [Nepenthes gracilis]